MADVVEVADQRHVHADPVEALADLRHGGGRLVAVDGDAHELRAGPRELGDLRHGGVDVGGVGVGHRLDDDRGAAADRDRAVAVADADAGGAVPGGGPGDLRPGAGERVRGAGIGFHGFHRGPSLEASGASGRT